MRKAIPSAARRALRPRHLHDAALKTPSSAAHVPLPSVQITTLANKLRVVTENTPGHFSSVGLYVDAGSRYETSANSGVSHFLDRMAFKSTNSRSDDEMAKAIDTLGGQIMCSSSRECIMYQSSHFHKGTPLALSLIADTVLNPSYRPDEIFAQRDAARYEIRELQVKPELALPEVLHEVAYNGQTLGNPLLCREERIDLIDAPLMRSTAKEWYTPERMVIAGAGMRHEELVELTDKYFSSLKASSTSPPPPQPTAPRPAAPQPTVPPNLLHSSSPSIYKSLTRAASSYLLPNHQKASTIPPSVLNPHSTYTGGYRFVPDAESEFSHLYIAYEGVGIHDDDIYTLATMQVLLGGGGSFSAGGPGKGMYSRLYTQILNHFPQIDHCASFHHIYTDSSLFGLFASFVPNGPGRHGNTASQILPHLIHQLSLLLYKPVPAQELSRAKNQLKSSLMMALESRAVEVEDLGRQVLVHNRKVPVTEMTEKVDQITADQVARVAMRIFGPQSGNKPTVVAMGRDEVGDFEGTMRKYGVSA